MVFHNERVEELSLGEARKERTRRRGLVRLADMLVWLSATCGARARGYVDDVFNEEAELVLICGALYTLCHVV